MTELRVRDRRTALIERFFEVRAATESLAAHLSPEDQQLQSMPNCSPIKWHRAHTTWFFEEFLLAPAGVPVENAVYRVLFNSYYEAVGSRHPRPQRGLLSRPSAGEIGVYRQAIEQRVGEYLLGLDDAAFEAISPILELGLAHEEQHQELMLTDILHAFWLNPTHPAYRDLAGSSYLGPRAKQGERGERGERGGERGARGGVDVAGEREAAGALGNENGLRYVRVEGGLCSVGRDMDDREFQFDNEGPRHRVWVEPFELATRPISTGVLREFIEAKGYENPAFWLSQGLDWVRAEGVKAPLYWAHESGSLRRFTLDGWIEPTLDSPACHLNYYEADAIARFLDARLPTEQEWEICAASLPSDRGNFRDSGELRPVGFRREPRQESQHQQGSNLDASTGFEQVFGDVWEWTASAYAPYPGFRAAQGAVGEYNGKFMVSQMVLRGGSCLTPRGHLRSTYRNFWHPDTQFQMSGARVARSLEGQR